MIPVSALYQYTQMMLDDKWGYIWGTSGIKWTQARQNATSNDMAQKYGSKWIGHMVADCSGVMVYIWKQYGMSIYHGSNTIVRKYCGQLTKTPQPGYAAFKWRKQDTSKYPDGKGDFYHIGIVGKDGKTVYEAKGTQAGFTTSKASTWDYFAPFKDVNYNSQEQIEPVVIGDNMTGYVNTVSGKLNIRASANTKAPIITQLEKGTKITITGETGDWYQIQINNKVGYASKKYIMVESEPEPIPTPEPEPEPVIPKITYWGVFIPCANEAAAKELQTKYQNATLINYKSSDGEDG